MSGVQDANDRTNSSVNEPCATIRAHRTETDIIQDAKVKRAYPIYLQNQALNAMIRERADNLRNHIVTKYAALDPYAPKDIAVFAISAAQYLEWLEPSRLREPAIKPQILPSFNLQTMIQRLRLPSRYSKLARLMHRKHKKHNRAQKQAPGKTSHGHQIRM